MKTKTMLILLSLLMCFFLFACRQGMNEASITGTYVNHAGGTYSLADDTLDIEHEEGNHCLIHRRTGFNLIRNHKKGKREYETEKWKAIYDEQRELLIETRRGKIITFQKDKLRIGNREYQKIN